MYFSNRGLALDVLCNVFWPVWRERTFLHLQRNLILFGVAYSGIGSDQRTIEMLWCDAFWLCISNETQNNIRGGVKGMMYCIPVVSQYVFQHCDAIIEWMIVVWMIVVWMNAEWIRIHRGGQTATVGRMGCMGIINSGRTLSSLLSSLLSFLLSSLFSSLFSESESGRSF